MTPSELDEQRMLSAVRSALSPDEADAQRTWASLKIRLGEPPAGSTNGPLESRVRELAGWRAVWRNSRWPRRIVLGLLIAFASGFAGYVQGRRTERARATQVQTHSVAPLVSPPSASSAPRSGEGRDVAVAPAPVQQPVPARSVHRRERSVVSPVPSAEPSDTAASLEEEVRTLRRVERALRQGNARLALALLDTLDERVRPGKLGEERAAARVLAQCALGYDSPPALVAAFTAQYPSSAYLARIESACTVRDESPGEGDRDRN